MGATTDPSPRRRGRRILIAGLSLLVVVALAVGGFLIWDRYFRMPDAPVWTAGQPAPITATQHLKAVSSDAPVPTPSGVAAALRRGLKDPALGELTGMVSDPLTGKVLWTLGEDKPRTPASNAKILTASAVLLEMKHDARLQTKVVVTDDGQAILVGAGDPTLTAQPADADTFYTSAPRIADLADQIKKSGVEVTSVAVAPSSITGPSMEKSWSKADIAGGDIAPLTSLMLDAGRKDPMNEYSPRSDRSELDAGAALAAALDLDTDVEEKTPPADAKQIAVVESAPLDTRVGDMMRFSDNVLAEQLAMELSVSMGGPESISGGASAVLKVLEKHGFDVDGVTLRDSSGLSTGDRVPAKVLDELVSAAAGDKQPELRPLLDTFPVAGGTGTLADRFDPDKNPAAGWVRAKTGTLTGVSSLTGIVQTVDGRVLAFALMSGGTSPTDARPALDALAGTLRECGCR
ncbi:MAG: D-alanyl-D-alanine carboxypeptidase/D-alanyl-D-alanine-endopeptidase [Gordonia sp. (in: high G+C Gram-positive bacteria)]